MANDLNLSPFLSALPALAGAVRLLWPSGQRGLTHAVERLASVAASLPPEADTKALLQTINRLTKELAFQEDRRRRRSPDGAAIATVIFLLLSATVGSWMLLASDHWALRVLGGFVALGSALLSLGGIGKVNPVRDEFSYERDAKDSRQERK